MLTVSLIASVIPAKAAKTTPPNPTTTLPWTYRHDHR